MVSIDDIPSIINNSPDVFDLEKPFTFIEFIKLFPYTKEQDAEYFDAFTRYLHDWAEHKNSGGNEDL